MPYVALASEKVATVCGIQYMYASVGREFLGFSFANCIQTWKFLFMLCLFRLSPCISALNKHHDIDKKEKTNFFFASIISWALSGNGSTNYVTWASFFFLSLLLQKHNVLSMRNSSKNTCSMASPSCSEQCTEFRKFFIIYEKKRRNKNSCLSEM